MSYHTMFAAIPTKEVLQRKTIQSSYGVSLHSAQTILHLANTCLGLHYR
jgi:hypothetical protein